jgi:hypothetical protein
VLFDQQTHGAYVEAAAELAELFPNFQILAEATS